MTLQPVIAGLCTCYHAAAFVGCNNGGIVEACGHTHRFETVFRHKILNPTAPVRGHCRI